MMNLRTLLSGTISRTGVRSRRVDEADAARILRRRSQRGVALVVTLILLAVITTLAIAFLALTQRETGAVDAMSRTTDAEMAADSALERAKAEILAVYPARNTDVLNNGPHTIGPDMFVSVCCQDYNPATRIVTRYNREMPDQRLTNIYDAAPPVFVDTNRPTQPGPRGPLDDRFYVNVNRNLSFEETGYVTNTVNASGNGPGGFQIERDAGGNPVINWRIGDPQWIGVLRNPRRPLSADNPFIARYAFMVLPAGRSLDVNWIHNDANNIGVPGPGGSWYSRNQGVGSYELNLAGFLNDLNTNVWSGYVYQTAPGFQSTGVAFSDAWQILNARYDSSKPTVNRVGDHFALFDVQSLIEGQGVDLFGNRTFNFATIQNWPWPGSASKRHIFDVNDYFNGNSILSLPPANRPGFLDRLGNISLNGNSYDRYTFYRMLAQLGTDSDEEEEGKVNINYVTIRSWVPGSSIRYRASDMVRWTNTSPAFVTDMGRPGPELFFLTAITNLIAREPDLASFVTNRIAGTVLSIPVFTNHAKFGDPPHFSTYTTNFPIRGPLYSARLHQLLQIAANIYDATVSNRVSAAAGSPHFPTVFRPWFTESNGNVFITDYTVVEQADAILVNKWVDLDTGELLSSPVGSSDLVFGVPLIIGARSGLPSFNELGVVSLAQATRKLKMIRTSLSGLTLKRPYSQLDQRFSLHVRTMLQMEARNANTRPYPNLLQMITQGRPMVDLKERTNGPSVVQTQWSIGSTNNFTPALWGAEVVESEQPSKTNLVVSPLFVTDLLDLVVNTNAESISGTNQWTLALTNRLLFYLIDRSVSGGRIIDAVSLSRPHNVFEIGKLLDSTDDVSGEVPGIWNPQKIGTDTLNQGILRQIDVSKSGDVPEDVWGSWEDSNNKPNSVRKFYEYCTNLVQLEDAQVPFSPSRLVVQANYFQVDDPLVHYTFQDLRDDPDNTKKKTGIVPINTPSYTNLTEKLYGMNPHSKPWNKGSFKPDVEEPGQTTLDPTIRDPGILHSSLWNFPTNLFPSVGWLGRVHRGTPWQTIYLKSRPLFQPADWIDHTGNQRGYDPDQAYAVSLLLPQRDWELLDVFTTAPHPNATRGRFSVNQTNQAAWSALLSGIQASVPKPDAVDEGFVAAGSETIQPYGILPALIPDAVLKITQSINVNRTRFGSNAFNPRGQFRRVGQILAAPELSDASPFLSSDPALFDPFAPGGNARIYDEDYERIPQQILSLLKIGEPKFVVYAWGQSLKPARQGVPLDGSGRIDRSQPLSGPSINVSGDRLVNNYQITGETATKAVVRVVFPERLANGEIDYQKPKLVVENFNVIDVE